MDILTYKFTDVLDYNYDGQNIKKGNSIIITVNTETRDFTKAILSRLFCFYRGYRRKTANKWLRYEFSPPNSSEEFISELRKIHDNNIDASFSDYRKKDVETKPSRANCLVEWTDSSSKKLETFIPHTYRDIENYVLLGDYRRIVADVFYTLYKQYSEQMKIDTIQFIKSDGKSETLFVDPKQHVDIENYNRRVAFWVSDNQLIEKPRQICLPIELSETSSHLLENGDDLYYELKDGNKYLDFYKNYNVNNYNIALFYGKNEEGIQGIYYCWNNKLQPKIQLIGEKIVVRDVKKKLYKIDSNDSDITFQFNCPEIEGEKYDVDWYKKLEKIVNEIVYGIKFKEINFIHINAYQGKYGFHKDETIKIFRMNQNNNNNFVFRYPEKNDSQRGDNIYLKIIEIVDSSEKTDYHLKPTQLWCECGNGISICLNKNLDQEEILRTNKESWYYCIERQDSKSFLTLDFSVFERYFMNDGNHDLSEKIDELCCYFKEDKFNSLNSDKCKELIKSFAGEFWKKFNALPEPKKKELIRNSSTQCEIAVEEIKEKLFDGLTPNLTVAQKVCDEIKKWKKTGKKQIPNLAIMGQPGTGKTTLVKRIASCFDEKEVRILSPSDLKGAYVGHTIPKVYDILKDASEKEQILFLDEAYMLQEDPYGKEALAYLLPIMTGDRKIIIKTTPENQKSETFDLEKEGKGIPPIWMAGYEDKMRKVLSQNQGLYRRMETLTLPVPTCSNLFEALEKQAKIESENLCKNIKYSEKEIKDYFTWAGAKEIAGYFGNYAGVEKFLNTCTVRGVDNEGSERAQVIINQIIDESKKEYKAQYKAVLKDQEKTKFQVYRDVDTKLDDVKGNKTLCDKLKKIIDMLINQETYNDYGIQVPKGALLVGLPGTGKTFIARAVAGEFQNKLSEYKKDKQIAFIPVIATELYTPGMIEILFEEASQYDASIIFIDEIDAIGGNRFKNKQSQPLLIQLMKELDGFDTRKNIFVMAATNAPESLDEALKRPGRFDQIIEVSCPDSTGRKDIIKEYISKLKYFKNTDTREIVEAISSNTKGFTPANLKNLINLAAIDFMSNIPSDTSKYMEKFKKIVEEKIDTLRIGERKPNNKKEGFSTDENKGCSATAIHEVGHAIVSLLQNMEPFEKITILPRGNALGYVKPSTKNELYTKKDFLNNIRACMGGRVAEELFYGDNISVGAAQDIQMATKLAEDMVAEFGMSDVIGMMSVKKNTGNYLENNSEYTCSDTFRYEVEREVQNLLAKQMEIVREELSRKKDIIEKLARKVFDKETMSGEEFTKEYNELLTGESN